MTRYHFKKAVSLILLLLLPIDASTMVSVQIVNSSRAIFSGKTNPLDLHVSGGAGTIVFDWSLTLKGRTLSKGSQTLRKVQNQPQTITLELWSPLIKSKTTQDAILTVIERGEVKSGAFNIEHQFGITIYSSQPLVSMRQDIEALNIKLYDPLGNTEDIFDAIGLPYSSISKSNLIHGQLSGLIIIGDDTDLANQRGLIEVMLDDARKGGQYLVLNPSTIKIPLTPATTDIPPPTIQLESQPIRALFAKGLLPINGERKSQNSIELSANRGLVVAQISNTQRGSWRWLELRYNDANGHIVVTSLPIVERLTSEPNQQILFAALLTYLSDKPIKNDGRIKR